MYTNICINIYFGIWFIANNNTDDKFFAFIANRYAASNGLK